MIRKMPGFLFSGYQEVAFLGKVLVSEPQYKEMLEDYLQKVPGARENYNELIAPYELSNGIPKYRLFIKLDPEISDERREFIADGLRAFFKSDEALVLDRRTAESALTDSTRIFQLFLGIVGSIALILAFFLLLTSTTQNVKENVWEYGCLRAIGFTKA